MSSLRQISVVLLVLAAGLLMIGAGGFSTTETDRPVGVSVVDDDQAYLGITAEQDDGELNVTITNRFVEPITVTQVKAGEGPEDITENSEDGHIEPGEQASKYYDPPPADAEKITVYAEGENVSLEVTTDVDTTA